MSQQPAVKTDGEQQVFCLEDSVRLSESFLWDRQRRFYETAGVSAWQQSVPLRITTTRFMACAYVDVFTAWLRDLRSGSGTLDESRPVYVVELGSGPGRFAFHFLRRLREVFPANEELAGIRL